MLIHKYSIKDIESRFKAEKNVKVKSRIQIILYLKEGKTQRDASAEFRVSVGIVPYWKKRFEKKGFEGLYDREGRGRKSSLNKKQLKQLSNAIDKGIEMKDGYKRGYKTKDVRELISKKFGIDYTTRNCTKILHREGYNLKVPRPRNKSRNQNNVDEFKQEFKKNFLVWKKEQ